MRIDWWTIEYLRNWLGFKTITETRNWVKAKNVHLHDGLVYSLEAEFAYDKETIILLRKNFGSDWGIQYALTVNTISINKDNKNELKAFGKYFEKLHEKGFNFDLDPTIELIKIQNEFSELSKPISFDELFDSPELAEKCLDVLRKLRKPSVSAGNVYIGKHKGVIASWVLELLRNKEKQLIRKFSEKVYVKVLNEKIRGLNLSKDGSEFRTPYKLIERHNIDEELRDLISRISYGS